MSVDLEEKLSAERFFADYYTTHESAGIFQPDACEFAEAYAKHCAALGRAEGLAEAAKIAEKYNYCGWQGGRVAQLIAEAIRALKDKGMREELARLEINNAT